MKRTLLALSSTLGLVVMAAQVRAQMPGNPDPTGVLSGEYRLDPRHSKLNWGTSHFGFSTYTGEFTDFDANLILNQRDPAKNALNVTIDTASIETNDDELNGHLRSPDFFNAAAHPTATFRSTKVELTGATSAQVSGDLTLLGKTQPVTLSVRFNGAGNNPVTSSYTVGFSAEGTVRRTDFGMDTYAPAIGDEVKLIIEAEFVPSSSQAQPN